MAVIAVAIVTSACGGGDVDNTANPGSTSSDQGSPATSSSPATIAAPAAAAGPGACKYVTTAQASGLAGSPVKAGVTRTLATGPVTFEYCDYIFDPGNAPGVTVAVADLGNSGPALFDQFRQSKTTADEFQAVSGIGDEAFYGSGNLNVRKGNKGLIVFVGRNNASPRGARAIPDETQLAALILPQL